MTEAFDKEYWETHWQQANGHASDAEIAPNPYLAREIGGRAPGAALDAGCGEGAEAIWLAGEGWQVTAADISAAALVRAAARAAKERTAPGLVQWVEADLCVWEPGTQFDLVTTHYTHPAMAQLAFYTRIAGWVAPGGTLLIVGHGHAAAGSDHGHDHPAEASVTALQITAGLEATHWDIVTADEPIRTLTDRAGRIAQLQDVVVCATRRP